MADQVKISVSRRDAGRILKSLRRDKTKFLRGVNKFGDDFDPELGANMREGLEAYTQLVNILEDAMK